jgi:hypothetical protein
MEGANHLPLIPLAKRPLGAVLPFRQEKRAALARHESNKNQGGG